MTNYGLGSSRKWKLTIGMRPFQEYSPESFREYIRSLYEEKARKKAKPYAVRRNAKGTLVVTVRRKPKWLALDELRELSSDLVSFEELQEHCLKKGLKLYETTQEGELHEGTT